jgi:ubiquinone/menaquinone biosynthesis C-methylase UbiE
MQRPAPALRARAPTTTAAAAPLRPPGRRAVVPAIAAAARPRRPVVAARASSDNETTTTPTTTDRGNRRAALACGCAACAFALLGAAATRPGTAAPSASAAAANDAYLSRERGGAYDEYFAKAMGTMQVYETEVAGLKRQLFGELARDLFSAKKKRRRQADDDDKKPITLLELGVGRGPNFQVLAEAVREAGGDISRGDVRVVGVDPNPAMLPYARESADSAGFPRESVELRALYGEQLKEAFSEGKFDAAIVTLVLCSVPDVPKTLEELKGVVRSGGGSGGGGDDDKSDDNKGRLLLIEHVRDPNPKSLRRLGQVLLNPLQRALADGCNLDRDTEAELRRAGLLGEGARENERRLRRLEVDGLGLLAPHLAGVLEV